MIHKHLCKSVKSVGKANHPVKNSLNFYHLSTRVEF